MDLASVYQVENGLCVAIPYRVLEAAELPDRLPPVLTVLYLIFNDGYCGTSGPLLRTNLCLEAVSLARVLAALTPAPDDDDRRQRGVVAGCG